MGEKKCHQCKKVIEGGVLKALDNSWHPECFCCNECKKPITEVNFHTKDKHPYCNPCYVKRFAKTCHACDEPILDKSIQALGVNWHEDHWVCAGCSDKLSGQKFMEVGGTPYCQKCYLEKHADRCKACGDPIAEKVILALDAKWHEKCFKCVKCSKSLGKDASFQVENGQPKCVKC